MQLAAIREAKAGKIAEARSLVSADTLTPEQKTAFDKLKGEITALEADEQRARFIEEAERRSLGVPVDRQAAALEQRVSLVEAINAHAEQRSLTGALAEYNAEQKRQGIQAKGVLVPQSIFNETRAAQTTTTATGIVPDDFRADQFVGILRNSLAIKGLGARVLPNLRGDVVVPRQTGTSTAQWLSEGDGLTDTGLTFDNIRMEPKHVGAITELSHQLQAANLARVQHAIESAPIGSDEHAKLTRLSMALARAVAVHPTATAGRAADQVNQNTAERQARQDDGDDLIPRLRAV